MTKPLVELYGGCMAALKASGRLFRDDRQRALEDLRDRGRQAQPSALQSFRRPPIVFCMEKH